MASTGGTILQLQPGQRITAPFLRAPAVVKTFAQRNGYELIDVVLENEHHTFQSKRVSDAQLAQIEVLNETAPSCLEDSTRPELSHLFRGA